MPTTSSPPPPVDQLESTDGHFQIIVPNFASAAPAVPIGGDASIGPVQLSSFLRLGTASTTASGGETDPPSTYGPQLLGVALAATPIAAGNLVADGIVPGNQTPLFADDVRDQGAANNANGLTPAQRAAESAVLLTKGGWRDHTDGNRISTTYGDKVEVVRGNMKLVVLGRQDNPTSGHTFESSGGMLQDNDAAPGQVTEISWVETGQGTWRVVETSTKGDVDSTFDGKVVERFVGGSVTTIIGKESQATATSALPSYSDASTSTDPTIARMYLEYQDAISTKNPDNAYVDASVSFEDYLTQRGYSTNGGSSHLDFYHQESGGSNPYVLEQTWATRIETYTGSAATPVPTIIETTYASSIRESTYAHTIDERVGSSGSHVSKLSEEIYADTISSTTNAAVITEKKTVSGSIDEVTIVPLATQTFTGALVDTHIGFKWEVVVGAWGAARVGGSLEVFLGLGAEVNIGPALEVNMGLSIAIATTTIGVTKLKWENDAAEFKNKTFSWAQVGASLGTFGFYTIT